MKKIVIKVVSLFLITVSCFYCSRIIFATSTKHTKANNTVTFNIPFKVMTSTTPLSGAKVIIIDINGNVIGTATTDKDGYVLKKLTVPIDKRYYWLDPNKIEPRGTVTAIAVKKGYHKSVLFEVPVSAAGSTQLINLYPDTAGERNEADVQYGNTHHLEVASLVDKYSKYYNK